MTYILPLILILLSCASTFALEQPKLTEAQIHELDKRDSELFGKIVGVWLFESMGQNMRHVAQRTIYRDDGTFVSDYRISSAGEISYRRATGFWYLLMGWFCEEETKSTDERLIPRMVRWVTDPIDKELKTASRTGTEAVLIRGNLVGEGFDCSLGGLSQKEFDASLGAKNLVGFVPEDTEDKDSDGKKLYRWILKSRLLDQGDSKKTKPDQK